MTYKEYSNQISAYESAQALRKSLQMTIRMNKVWLTNKNSKRGKAIENAQSRLDSLIIPPKPKQPIGYEVIVNGGFDGFVPNDNIKEVQKQAAESLGHNNFTLNPKPRFRD